MPRILLVEPDPADRREALRVLTFELGARVQPHEALKTAMSAVGTLRFQAAVVNVCLPDGSGLDLVRFVREREARDAEREPLVIVVCTLDPDLVHASADALGCAVADKRHLVRDLRVLLRVHDMPTKPRG